MKTRSTFHRNKPKLHKLLVALLAILAMTVQGCDKSGGSYSLLADSQNFSQTNATDTYKKMDILWVVDNSSSMAPFQQNLLQNFNSFIQNFVQNGYDFHLAVTTTEAYKAQLAFANDENYSALRDGVYNPGGTSTHSGYPIISASTPNIESTFVFNANQGQTGSGDERAFSSISTALSDPNNSGFRRPDAFLAVIILSDEDDFTDPNRVEGSWTLVQTSPQYVPDHDYADPNLISTSDFIAQMDALTNIQMTGFRNYNISSIAVIDQNCLASHTAAEKQDPNDGYAATTILGQRYMDVANQTNGVLGDICSSNYGDTLNLIQQKILELSTQFRLTRTPVVSTISVQVNGVTVPTDATNGWTYDPTANSIVFHGSAIPVQGANIAVAFQPTTAKN